jgi:methionyl-tRNA formyltransferase
MRAVVFGYREVGHRCLTALLDAGVEIPLVFTNPDHPAEQRWFDSVAELCRSRGIEVLTDDPNQSRLLDRLRRLAPDYLFSFYYRALLSPEVLATARSGALNLHGSLLPQYRGRAPANWAILRGETVTGATLHVMQRRADAGPILDQEAVAIGINDTALEVSLKIADAAVKVLQRMLPVLRNGMPSGRAQDLSQGAYFGGRKPEDGKVDWALGAWSIHNLIRAVAPPFPGAFTLVGTRRLLLAGSRWVDQAARAPNLAPRLYADDDKLWADCVDHKRIQISDLRLDDQVLQPGDFQREFGDSLSVQ